MYSISPLTMLNQLCLFYRLLGLQNLETLIWRCPLRFDQQVKLWCILISRSGLGDIVTCPWDLTSGATLCDGSLATPPHSLGSLFDVFIFFCLSLIKNLVCWLQPFVFRLALVFLGRMDLIVISFLSLLLMYNYLIHYKQKPPFIWDLQAVCNTFCTCSLLRSREFLWQEGHTAFATKEEADEEVFGIC